MPEKTNIWRDCVDGYYDWVKEHIAEVSFQLFPRSLNHPHCYVSYSFSVFEQNSDAAYDHIEHNGDARLCFKGG